ncbi:hypothetical protein R1sor_026304 [Riccia sorocarpa]|uniref:Neprosin PEP catalytic domain-containing protein n=1 Tax=Riccia sorocarpa TaxID=122646 RepID=A0ABD3GCG6_9MARC
MENYLVVSLILVWSFSLQRSYAAAESGLHFKLSTGEEISCVPIYEQPSLNSLAHLKIPKSIPSEKSAEEQSTQVIPDGMEIKLAEQTFKSEVGTCPEGMIPILRNQRPIRRTRGSFRQGVKSRHGDFQHTFSVNTSEADPANLQAAPAHEYAQDGLWPDGGTLYRGAKGYFNVWQPYVELSSEFSLSQLWITAGSYGTNDLNTIEVGWQVYQDRLGDDLPHLFVYWTTDGYVSTGCYDLQCPGFVQVSSSLVVGGSLDNIAQTDGTQFEIRVIVYWDQGTDAWWLVVNDESIGYWPNSMFTSLQGGADHVEWGGEIINSETGNRHTRTDMGSGRFPKEGFGKAAFIRSLQSVTSTPPQVFVDLPLPSPVDATNAHCYNAKIFQDTSSDWGTHLYFGGPGYNSGCPT